MKSNLSARLRQAALHFLDREQNKPALLRWKETAVTPLWIAQGAFWQAFRLLQLGRPEPARLQAEPPTPLDNRFRGSRPAQPGVPKLDRLAEAAIRFLDASASARAKSAGRMVLPLVLLTMRQKIPGLAWIGNWLSAGARR